MFNNNSYKINKIINSSSEDIYLGATRFDIQMKNKNGEYIITTPIFSEDDANVYASMLVEYKTKDFKNYTPLRVQKNIEKNVWTIIK